MATRNDYLHCRMTPDDMAMLDRIKEYRGLTTRTQAVAFLIKGEVNRINRESAPRRDREKSAESAE